MAEGTKEFAVKEAPAEELPEQEYPPEQSASDEVNWQAKHQELQDQFTRLAADFDNYRKRMQQEQEAMRHYGTERAIMQLLPVMDNLDRATASLSETSDAKLLYQSFRLLYKQLLDGLETIGVQKIDAVGQPFDPSLHEAVSQVESAEVPEHHVAQEMQTGYRFQDRVIRPALVAVSSGGGPAEASSAEAEEAKSVNPFKKDV